MPALVASIAAGNGCHGDLDIPRSHVGISCFFPSARQLVRQDGGVTAPRAGRGRPGWPMAAHQLASAYVFLLILWFVFCYRALVQA
jgi:hypothetical protein